MDHQAEIWAIRLRFGPSGWDLGHQAGIWANSMGFGPTGWDFGQQARIWASKLRFGSKVLGWGDVWTDVTVHPCVLQDIGPLGPLPKKETGKLELTSLPWILE